MQIDRKHPRGNYGTMPRKIIRVVPKGNSLDQIYPPLHRACMRNGKFFAPLLFIFLSLPKAWSQRTVFSLADSGPGSLRDAIASAADGDIITFGSDLAGQTISLTSGKIILDKNISIRSSESTIIISGSNLSRVFHITAGSEVSLDSLTIRDGFLEAGETDADSDGRLGGGIFNEGTLNLSRCILRENHAHSGGGISGSRDSWTFIDQCYFDQNEAAFDGGAMECWGHFDLSKSTISNNTAQVGGGLYYRSSDPDHSIPQISTCTFFGNSALVGGGISSIDLKVNNCTIVSNNASVRSGGIHIKLGDELELNSSIVSLNESPDSPQVQEPRTIRNTGSIVGGDPMLEPPADHGGIGPTLLPMASSPAVDPENGAPALPFETDQRGHFRSSGTTTDIGAVEFGSLRFPDRSPEPIVTTASDRFRQTSVIDPASLSLREAIAYSAPNAIVSFADHIDEVDFIEGEIVIPHDVTIKAAGVVMDASSRARFFNIPTSASLTLEGGVLRNGRMTGEPVSLTIPEIGRGGAIYATGALNLQGCQFEKCRTSVFGGAVYSEGDLEIEGCLFEECEAGWNGAAVQHFSHSQATTASVNTSEFRDNGLEASVGNTANEDIAALYLRTTRGQVTIDECFFTGNGVQRGYAAFAHSLDTRISRSTFAKNNRALAVGGLKFTLENSTFSGNPRSFDTGLTSSSTRGEIIHCTFQLDDPVDPFPFVLNRNIRLMNCIISGVESGFRPGINVEVITSYVGRDARLSPLAHLGGRWPTMVPLPDSPALGIGQQAMLGNDQRNFNRGLDEAPDAGAVERQDTEAEVTTHEELIVTRSDDPVLWSGRISDLSLRQAISLARSEGHITIDNEFPQRILKLERGQLVFSNRLTLAAPGGVSLSSGPDLKILLIDFGVDLTMENFTFERNQNLGDHPIEVFGTLNLRRCRIVRNEFRSRFINVYGNLDLQDTHFGGNDGGVLVLLENNASALIRRCSFVENRALPVVALPSNGSSELVIQSSTIANNESNDGGAIFSGTPLTITNSTITGNRANNGIGGVDSPIFSPIVSNSIITQNEGRDGIQISGAEALEENNFLSGDPQLAPPGFYEGPTMSAPPLPGSPVIDAGEDTTEPTDQRGLPRSVGTGPDLGASEFQGELEELRLIFHLDSDRDGVSNGLEIAMGRDPFTGNDPLELNLRILPDGRLSTGYDVATSGNILFKVTRSVDLKNFEVISSNENGPLMTEEGLLVIEEPDRTPGAFYRLESSPR